jgi:putative aminopeptidase FrvX
LQKLIGGVLVAFGLTAGTASADPAARLLYLSQIPGTAGHEAAVRDAIEMSLPASARVRADNLGSMTLSRRGTTGPHVLIAAALDEPGFVVSAIRDDGYLRVHRHAPAAAHPLGAQFFVGQPVLIGTAGGRFVPGVTATPSTHLNAFRPEAERTRIQTEDDVWIDVGAASAAEVAALGIRMLDAVTLGERAVGLGHGRVAGVAVSHRAGAVALVEAIRRQSPPVAGAKPPAISLAWVAQSQFGQRGLVRLLETLKPDRVVLLRGGVAPGPDPRGSVGEPGRGPVVADGDTWIAEQAAAARVTVQTVPSSRLAVNVGERYESIPLHVLTVPVHFGQTPVELADGRDVESLARLVAHVAGFGPLLDDNDDLGDLPDPAPVAVPLPSAAGAPPADGALMTTFESVAREYGVSGHEAPVRDAVLKALPAWAKPQVDARGNVRVTVGEGPRPIVFVAHMDEVGFEIAGIGDDGMMSVRARGGMYLSLHEAHPMVIHTAKGPIAVLMTPRRGYTSATVRQPALGDLSLFTGASSKAGVEALGVAPGQSVTVRKQVMRLAGSRVTVRAMDDRVGTAALVEAVRRIDPATLANRVTFVWSVEEETGLTGASFVAQDLRPQKINTAFAVDTFVSSDTPVDGQRLALAPLGGGAVLRGMDSRTLVGPATIDRIVAIARQERIPLQIGVTAGGTDASPFAAVGAMDVGLSWPGRYSHSPVEVMDLGDAEALVRLIVALARHY